jgi:hypothetical protein
MRQGFDDAFSRDTAVPGSQSDGVPSTGHCAAVAMIVQFRLRGDLVEACVFGESHWFNRIPTTDGALDLDLTGDQFGYEPVRFAPSEQLYADGVIRSMSDVLPETTLRAHKLAQRTGIGLPVSFG